ncbi:MAG: hypothetical protein J1F23_07820 [Oscillospiraceae bacterium]|nr:hypothetical protein [Oscillospiraceae bacterium]
MNKFKKIFAMFLTILIIVVTANTARKSSGLSPTQFSKYRISQTAFCRNSVKQKKVAFWRHFVAIVDIEPFCF